MRIFVLGRVENIVRKGENAGYQHFLLFPQCFQKQSFTGSLKFGIVWERVREAAFSIPIMGANKRTQMSDLTRVIREMKIGFTRNEHSTRNKGLNFFSPL